MSDPVDYQEMLATGASPRQVDYWTRQGYLKPQNRERNLSGNPRYWLPAERNIARLMVAMTTAGIRPDTAAKAAREAVESGADEVELPGGLKITLPGPAPVAEPECEGV